MFSLDFFNNSTIFVCHYLAILFLFCLWGRVWGWDRLWWGSVWFPSEPSLNHPPLTLTLLHMFSSYLLLFRCYKRDTRSQYINGKLILLKKWGTFAIRIFIFRRIIKPNNKDSYEYSWSYIASWSVFGSLIIKSEIWSSIILLQSSQTWSPNFGCYKL